MNSSSSGSNPDNSSSVFSHFDFSTLTSHLLLQYFINLIEIVAPQKGTQLFQDNLSYSKQIALVYAY